MCPKVFAKKTELTKAEKETRENMRTQWVLKQKFEHVLAALTYENQLVMRVCLATGLRLGDVLNMRTKQLEATSFTIKEQKTGKRRTIRLAELLKDELVGNAGKLYVFEHRLNNRRARTRQAVWKDVKRAAKLFRISENLAPHSARKVYAVDALRKYGDLRKVRQIMNHRDEAVTQLYCLADILTERELKRKRGGKK